ncbi:PREDICTED: DNA replication complex GINS protein SLD5-like [Amphimedon queenslandica]|uniref:DNA replication complex GINS protein SLD5 n=1 Tax=Amphimedon queenslandica TaxID=400682 RepID=A0A1X7VP03_AMPQE|nr:PREDICTED: DNA replication complex GINS protein SLD5-like [Amphimedon queenslandica]|eukprot:XP_011409593.1 PREDICTED: DNA replication complex GINS protein SLD5-like [Amphimedon queenslandica]
MAESLEDTMDSDFEYRRMTIKEVVEKIEEAWQNEKLSPELLPAKPDLLECLVEHIKSLDESLSELSAADLVCSILKQELDRIKYVVCNYLKTRLQKIERYVWYYCDHPSHLSQEETKYAKEFASNLDTHLKEVVLQHLPTNFQDINKRKATLKPDTTRYVFMRALERKSNITIKVSGYSVTLDVEEGSQVVLPYESVSELVREGSAKLL